MKICKQNMSVQRKRKREKDLEFAKGINILEFIASEGWLNRRKKRCRFAIWTDAWSTYTTDMTALWEQTHLPNILSQHDFKDVLNADEFVLLFNNFQRKHCI